ncbi:Crinkler (CRN) family protein [Phytophthora palmivora]|uniref:Crinkler (CRN) family protein n=1 Tax=Phytophthora palmivora TaxID=4796 RepID=A0A2P4XKR8_9STRA|nr:Crinkler (CRN) family protein [Phytophthora palmivora]
MTSLGGCTSNGNIFWRLEDKQIASILVAISDIRESTPGNINVRANKKSIIIGSPGIGKSTLLCMMAFYLVFKHKKNVLVYRRLFTFEQENCLFYLGYEDGKVQFAVQGCNAPNAVNIYRTLISQYGISNVWLLLDGFRYQDIPEGVRTFKMLATSQQVDLKSQERTDAYCCLLPCWSKKDLWSMGL